MSDGKASAGFIRGAWRLAGPILRPHAPRLFLVLGISLMAATLSLAQPWLTKALIDDGILARNASRLLYYAGLIAALAVAGVLIGALNRRLYIGVSARALFQLRGQVFAHLLTLSPRFYSGRRVGEIMSRLDGDVAEVQRFVTDSLLSVVMAAITLMVSLWFMAVLSPALTVVALLALPLEAGFLLWMRPRLTRVSKNMRETAGAMAAFLVERLGAVRLIQSSAAAAREQQNLAAHQDDYRQRLIQQQMTAFATGAGPTVITTFATAAVFIVGGLKVIDGALSLGTLIAFASYLARAVGPIQTFLGLYAAAARAEVSIGRVMALLQEKPDVLPPAAPVALPSAAAGHLRFETVTFAHDDRTPVLQNVTADFPGGEKIGFVGASGSGKSTLVDLIIRLRDPDHGRISLDGVDLRDLDLPDLRRRVAVVSQETMLLDGSLMDNVRYVRPDADDSDVTAAIKAAGLAPVIARLPGGVHARIGERGARLSGGERQRVALARAILADPLVLILDEATTGIDTDTEADILAAVDRLYPRRTRLIVSHHPRTLKGVDRVFALRDGALTLASSAPTKENTGGL